MSTVPASDPARGRVALLDDDADLVEVLVRGLRRRGFDASGFTQPHALLEQLGSLDVVVTDLNLPGIDGLAVCQRVLERRPGLPVLMFTAFGSLDTAVSAIRAGAYDFLTKPVEVEALALALDRAVTHRRLTDEVRQLRAARPSLTAGDLLGDSPQMQALRSMVERAAPTEANVLVIGETGTGKELVARALHRGSRRSTAPFVALNCAAIPDHLLESELFGHVRGAFTDARAARPGLFVHASGGTLFLDEVGDLSPALQSKLLRVLQERVVRPVGAEAEVPIDVRVIAATHRDLEEGVRAGTFRADLLYRLEVIRLEVPPLRERGNDILLLAQHFVHDAARRSGRPVRGIAASAARRLLDHHWPGNVRELQNGIERAVALTALDQITLDDLPARIRGAAPGPRSVDHTEVPLEELPTLDEVERRYIVQVLERVDGNKALAARVLGLHRKTLYRKLEQHGL